jgi:hypothetical protein
MSGLEPLALGAMGLNAGGTLLGAYQRVDEVSVA